MNGTNDHRPSDDELHASLYSLLRDGDFGEDEPADDDTVRHEISMILEKANVLPTATQESRAEDASDSQDAQGSQPRQPPRPLPTKPGHPEPPRRPHRDRPPRKRRTRTIKSAQTGPGWPLPRTRDVEPFAQMVIVLVTVAAASAGLLFIATGSAEIATVVALITIIVGQASRNIKR